MAQIGAAQVSCSSGELQSFQAAQVIEGCLKTNYFTGLLDAAFDVALAVAECATAADK